MMKTKTSKRLFSLLLACTMAVSVLAMTVFASAEYAEDSTSIGRASNGSVISNMSMSTSIPAPTISYTTFNTAIKYKWSPANGSDGVAMTDDERYYYLQGSGNYSISAFIYDIGSKYCEPDFYAGKTYRYQTGVYSAETASLEHLEGGVVRYGYEATYKALGKFSPAAAPSYIPTSYDQSSFYWAHNSGFSRTIKGTIEYNGEVEDIEVNIPMLGYKTVTATVGNQKFYLRTGPNFCSIKVDNSGVSSAGFRFVFGDA